MELNLSTSVGFELTSVKKKKLKYFGFDAHRGEEKYNIFKTFQVSSEKEV